MIRGGETSVEKFVYKIRASKDVALPIEISRKGKSIQTTVTPRFDGSKATIGIGIANNVGEVKRVRAANLFEVSIEVYGNCPVMMK